MKIFYVSLISSIWFIIYNLNHIVCFKVSTSSAPGLKVEINTSMPKLTAFKLDLDNAKMSTQMW